MRSLILALVLLPAICNGQSWVQLPDFPGTPRDDAASFNWYDRVIVGTGMDIGFQLTNDWYAYSLISGSWQAVASLPASGRQYCSGFSLSDERGYLFGGLDASGPLNELWRYDALTDTWAQRASLPAPGRYACAVFTTGDNAYICGGILEGGTPTNEVWRYDLVSDTWTARSPMPGPPRHRAVAVEDLIVGGADSTFQALSDVYAYVELTDEWFLQPDLPASRFGASSSENLLFCGASALDQNHNTVLALDRITGTWDSTIIPTFPGGPRKGTVSSSQTYLADVGIHFLGLGINGPTRHNDWWRLDLPTGIGERTSPAFTIHPNPADQYLTVGRPPSGTWTVCAVLDGSGRIVLEKSAKDGTTISTAHLPQGKYVVRLTHNDQVLHAPLIILR